jgi:hypothetical protein
VNATKLLRWPEPFISGRFHRSGWAFLRSSVSNLLQEFRQFYEEMFPGCEIQLSGGDPLLILQRIDQQLLDCAILPMPVDEHAAMILLQGRHK